MNLFERDPLELTIALLVTMFVTWELGYRFGERADGGDASGRSRIEDAVLALLGLLLAFTFSTASTKHDRRTQLVVEEASAIGDVAGAVAMLAEPARSEIERELRDYLDVRIAMSRVPLADPAEAPLFARTRALQAELTTSIRQAIADANTPSTHVVLVGSLNEMTTAFEKRRAALRDHLPTTVVIMLGLSAAVSMFSLGHIQGARRRREHAFTGLFAALVSLVFFVCLDLEQPRRGIVLVSTWALESMRASLGP
jgi:hypothetical protein